MITIHWERWKHWKEHPEYKVSSDGRIKKNGKLVHQKINKDGYMYLDREQGKPEYGDRYIPVHRLVCHVFRDLVMEDKEPTVDHLNHNKRDNSLKNLELVSAKENYKRARQDLINVPETRIPQAKVNKIKTVAEDLFANTKLATTWINSAIKPILRNYSDKYYILKDGKYLALDDVPSLIESKLFKQTQLASKSAFKQDINTLVGMLKAVKNGHNLIYRKHIICRKQELLVIPQA